MASDVEICNVALSRIGIDQFLEDLSDPKPSAVSCSLHLPLVRRRMLEGFPWPFAQRTRALALLTTEIPGWTYSYRYPVDAARVHAVSDDGGIRVLRYSVFDHNYQPSTKVPYQTISDPDNVGDRLIVTDIEDAYVWYTELVEDANQMGELFRSALSWGIASEIALSLRASQAIAQYAYQQAQIALSQARAASLNEQGFDRLPEPEAITVR
jgi:hypothetical protein